MNCFNYTITRKQMKKLRKQGVLKVAVYRTQVLPAEGDRVYFNNFEEVFTIEKVTPTDGTIEDEASRPYSLGFFELSLRQLRSRFEIVSAASLYEDGCYFELGPTAGDAEILLAKFETELALAEAESEGRDKLPPWERERIIAETEQKTAHDFWGRIFPTVFGTCYEGSERLFKVSYNPVVAYLDEYDPFALMLFYREYDIEGQETTESIPVAYIDLETAEEYDLSTEDIQYIVEELFFETLLNFSPETSEAILENPTVIVPESQVEFYDGLISANSWEAGQECYFGYRVFN